MEKASAFMAYLCDFLGASSYLLCDTECWARWALPWFKPERMEEEPFFFFKKKKTSSNSYFVIFSLVIVFDTCPFQWPGNQLAGSLW